ncbi:response regulator [Gracilimonas sp.]|uniref:response regulator n=1 Tax=Gracilimonas sp. TaxID=1974203 RepID=UPI0032EDA1B6
MSVKSVILYVDDEHINLLLFGRLMSKHFEVLTAASAMEGLQMLDENPEVKVVITDLRMPKMDGLEFIKEAKKKFDDRPYIILSGFEKSDAVKDAIRQGLVEEYIQKPYSSEVVADRIKETIST